MLGLILSMPPNVSMILISIAMILIIVFVIILIHNMYEYIEYVHNRRMQTTHNVMDFSESLLNNLMGDVDNNYKLFLISQTKKHILSRTDKIELLAFSALMSNSTHEIKQLIKNAVRINGYYELSKKSLKISTAETSMCKLNAIYDSRSKEVYNIINSGVKILIPDSETLESVNILNMGSVKQLWINIIDRHITEIDKEIFDINNKSKKLFLILSKKLKYYHK